MARTDQANRYFISFFTNGCEWDQFFLFFQQFSLTWHKDIRPDKRTVCWDVSSYEAQAPILLYGCHGSQGNQLWRYDPVIKFSQNPLFFDLEITFDMLQVKQHLIHGGNPRCLDCDPGRKELYVSTCNDKSPTQRWVIEHFNKTALDNWKSSGIDEYYKRWFHVFVVREFFLVVLPFKFYAVFVFKPKLKS